MNLPVAFFTSPEWAQIVKALLHSLWQGGIVALVLAAVLRVAKSPVVRYRISFGALITILFGALLTWSALNPKPPAQTPSTVSTAPTILPAPEENIEKGSTPDVVVTATVPPPAPSSWTAWLALAWAIGTAAMLARVGVKLAGAERLRRGSYAVDDPRLPELLAEARRAVGIARQVRIAVIEQLTSPAVVGIVVPTLILPLSLVTTLSHEQIRFILLHELAHIRRGDYLANLFQLLAEALFFFNPAVWWISHQMRREREACCDALAIELSGAPADYARTLVQVAEAALQSTVAAPAFGEKQNSSSLADRIQRLLVPGYQPALRLTWRGMIGLLLLGTTVLMLSAVSTRMTYAAAAKLLTPKERIERIEKKTAEYDDAAAIPTYSEAQSAPKVVISGRIRTEDGSPVPRASGINVISVVRFGSIGTSISVKRDGTFEQRVSPGNIILALEAAGFAPLQFGPVTVTGTNQLANVELVLRRGFDATIKLMDVKTSEPLPGRTLFARFWTRGASQTSFPEYQLTTGADGTVILTNAVDLPLVVTVNTPGYELLERRFETVKAETRLHVALNPAKSFPISIRDKQTGVPIGGAKVRVLREEGDSTQHRGWTDSKSILGESGADGKLEINQLRQFSRYWLGVSAAGHQSAIVDVAPGASRADVSLGPELVVRGSVKGRFEGLQQIDNDFALECIQAQQFGNTSYPENHWIPLRITNGIGYFHFTNRVAGETTLRTRSGEAFARMIESPVSDWNIQLSEEIANAAKTNLPQREVVFRFEHKGGPAPRGTVAVTVPDSIDPRNSSSHTEEREITNSEVHVPIAVGGYTSIEPRRMLGYWFDSAGPNGSLLSINVTNGSGPIVIRIPLVPAGAIYARALNADGSPAGGLFFGLNELKRAPNRSGGTLGNGGDGFADNSPRKWTSGPLPPGGTYQVYGWRGNTFCVSKPIKLTDQEPDAEVVLRFPVGKVFHGIALGADDKPMASVELKAAFNLSGKNGFGLKSVFTDEQGRFELADATPELGSYTVEPTTPGIMAESVKLQLTSSPQVIRFKPGRHLAGQVVEDGTGFPIPDVELRTFNSSGDGGPTITTRTDAEGRFHFSTLRDGDYSVFVDAAELLNREKFSADGTTNHILKVRLQPWSKVKPKVPQERRNLSGEVVLEFIGFSETESSLLSPRFVLRWPTNSTGTFRIAELTPAPISAPEFRNRAPDARELERIDAEIHNFRFDLASVLGDSDLSWGMEQFRQEFLRFFRDNGVTLAEPKGILSDAKTIIVRASIADWKRAAESLNRRKPTAIRSSTVAAGSKPNKAQQLAVEFLHFDDPGVMGESGGKTFYTLPAPSIRFHATSLNASVQAAFLETGSAKERELPLEKIPGVRDFKFNLDRILGRSEMPGDIEVFRQAVQRWFEGNGIQFSPTKGVSAEGKSIVVRASFADWVAASHRSNQSGRKFTTRPIPEPTIIRTGEGRRAILMKLQDIRLQSFAADAQPLSEVIRQLSQQVRMSDPQTNGINFIINPTSEVVVAPNAPTIDPATGLPVAASSNSVATFDPRTLLVTIRPALTNARLADVVEAVVNGASKPIKYALLDYGIAFSPKSPGPEPLQLHMRRFKVNGDAFKARIGVTSSNTLAELQAATIRYLSTNGVDLSPTSGKNVFFNNNEETLSIRATAEELDRVEQILNGIGTQPTANQLNAKPQVKTDNAQLQMRRFRVNISQFWNRLGLTSSNSPEETQAAFMRFFSANADVDLSPESGRSVFFSDSRGDLLVRATTEEIGRIETALARMGSPTEVQLQSDTLVQSGKAHFEAGKLKEAQTELEKALALDPNHPAAKFYLGLAEGNKPSRTFTPIYQVAVPASSFTNFQEREFRTDTNGLALNLGNPEALANQLNTKPQVGSDAAQLQMRRYRVNVDQFFTRIGIPHSDLSHTNTMGEVQAAFLRFFSTNGVDLSPASGKNVFFSDSRGDIMIRATEEEHAKIEKALVGLGPSAEVQRQSDTLVVNGKFYYEAGKLDEAQAELEKALAIDPGNSAAKYYLGLVQRGGAAVSNMPKIVNPVIRWTNSEPQNHSDMIKRDFRPFPISIANAEERSFRMNTDRVIQNLESLKAIDMRELRKAQAAGDSSLVEQVVGSAILKWLSKNGVESNPAKSTVGWNNAIGILEVRATPEERKKIESFIVQLDPQTEAAVIHLQVEFFELPEAFARQSWNRWRPMKTSGGGIVAFVTARSAEEFRKTIAERKGSRVLSSLAITAGSGTQSEIKSVTKQNILFPAENGETYITNTVECGPKLLLKSWSVVNDGIEVSLSANLLEFIGYDDPGQFTIADSKGNETKRMATALARFRLRTADQSALIPVNETLVIGNPKILEGPTLSPSTELKREDPDRNLVILVTPTLIRPNGEYPYSQN